MEFFKGSEFPRTKRVAAIGALALTALAGPIAYSPDKDCPPLVAKEGDAGAMEFEENPHANSFSIELGEYNAKTGEGTIWNTVVKAAEVHGVKLATEKTKEAVDNTLDELELDWQSAKNLQPGYQEWVEGKKVFGKAWKEAIEDKNNTSDLSETPWWNSDLMFGEK